MVIFAQGRCVCFVIKGLTIYPPKERFLRTLSEGSLWFECSLSLYVIVGFFWFSPRDPCHLLCGGWWVVGGGWWWVGRIFEKY